MIDLGTTAAFEFYRAFLEWYVTHVPVETYLEIGCHSGGLTGRLAPHVRSAIGIDIADAYQSDWDVYQSKYPNLELIHISSDELFKIGYITNADLIFIDGSHDKTQVLIDIDHSLNILSPTGLIAVHDTFPPDEEHTSSDLCGTAYKAIALLKRNTSLQIVTFPVRFGLTLIRPEDKSWRNIKGKSGGSSTT